ncbi:MAG: FlgD immunoglobulin-like domain containing protein, partial [Candidatus Omnitrophota bacterium]
MYIDTDPEHLTTTEDVGVGDNEYATTDKTTEMYFDAKGKLLWERSEFEFDKTVLEGPGSEGEDNLTAENLWVERVYNWYNSYEDAFQGDHGKYIGWIESSNGQKYGAEGGDGVYSGYRNMIVDLSYDEYGRITKEYAHDGEGWGKWEEEKTETRPRDESQTVEAMRKAFEDELNEKEQNGDCDYEIIEVRGITIGGGGGPRGGARGSAPAWLLKYRVRHQRTDIGYTNEYDDFDFLGRSHYLQTRTWNEEDKKFKDNPAETNRILDSAGRPLGYTSEDDKGRTIYIYGITYDGFSNEKDRFVRQKERRGEYYVSHTETDYDYDTDGGVAHRRSKTRSINYEYTIFGYMTSGSEQIVEYDYTIGENGYKNEKKTKDDPISWTTWNFARIMKTFVTVVVSAIIGLVIGGPIGAIVGAIVGAIASWLIDGCRKPLISGGLFGGDGYLQGEDILKSVAFFYAGEGFNKLMKDAAKELQGTAQDIAKALDKVPAIMTSAVAAAACVIVYFITGDQGWLWGAGGALAVGIGIDAFGISIDFINDLWKTIKDIFNACYDFLLNPEVGGDNNKLLEETAESANQLTWLQQLNPFNAGNYHFGVLGTLQGWSAVMRKAFRSTLSQIASSKILEKMRNKEGDAFGWGVLLTLVSIDIKGDKYERFINVYSSFLRPWVSIGFSVIAENNQVGEKGSKREAIWVTVSRELITDALDTFSNMSAQGGLYQKEYTETVVNGEGDEIEITMAKDTSIGTASYDKGGKLIPLQYDSTKGWNYREDGQLSASLSERLNDPEFIKELKRQATPESLNDFLAKWLENNNEDGSVSLKSLLSYFMKLKQGLEILPKKDQVHGAPMGNSTVLNLKLFREPGDNEEAQALRERYKTDDGLYLADALKFLFEAGALKENDAWMTIEDIGDGTLKRIKFFDTDGKATGREGLWNSKTGEVVILDRDLKGNGANRTLTYYDPRDGKLIEAKFDYNKEESELTISWVDKTKNKNNKEIFKTKKLTGIGEDWEIILTDTNEEGFVIMSTIEKNKIRITDLENNHTTLILKDGNPEIITEIELSDGTKVRSTDGGSVLDGEGNVVNAEVLDKEGNVVQVYGSNGEIKEANLKSFELGQGYTAKGYKATGNEKGLINITDKIKFANIYKKSDASENQDSGEGDVVGHCDENGNFALGVATTVYNKDKGEGSSVRLDPRVMTSRSAFERLIKKLLGAGITLSSLEASNYSRVMIMYDDSLERKPTGYVFYDEEGHVLAQLSQEQFEHPDGFKVIETPTDQFGNTLVTVTTYATIKGDDPKTPDAVETADHEYTMTTVSTTKYNKEWEVIDQKDQQGNDITSRFVSVNILQDELNSKTSPSTINLKGQIDGCAYVSIKYKDGEPVSYSFFDEDKRPVGPGREGTEFTVPQLQTGSSIERDGDRLTVTIKEKDKDTTIRTYEVKLEKIDTPNGEQERYNYKKIEDRVLDGTTGEVKRIAEQVISEDEFRENNPSFKGQVCPFSEVKISNDEKENTTYTFTNEEGKEIGALSKEQLESGSTIEENDLGGYTVIINNENGPLVSRIITNNNDEIIKKTKTRMQFNYVVGKEIETPFVAEERLSVGEFESRFGRRVNIPGCSNILVTNELDKEGFQHIFYTFLNDKGEAIIKVEDNKYDEVMVTKVKPADAVSEDLKLQFKAIMQKRGIDTYAVYTVESPGISETTSTKILDRSGNEIATVNGETISFSETMSQFGYSLPIQTAVIKDGESVVMVTKSYFSQTAVRYVKDGNGGFNTVELDEQELNNLFAKRVDFRLTGDFEIEFDEENAPEKPDILMSGSLSALRDKVSAQGYDTLSDIIEKIEKGSLTIKYFDKNNPPATKATLSSYDESTNTIYIRKGIPQNTKDEKALLGLIFLEEIAHAEVYDVVKEDVQEFEEQGVSAIKEIAAKTIVVLDYLGGANIRELLENFNVTGLAQYIKNEWLNIVGAVTGGNLAEYVIKGYGYVVNTSLNNIQEKAGEVISRIRSRRVATSVEGVKDDKLKFKLFTGKHNESTIEFIVTAEEEEKAEIKIFDLTGKIVRTMDVQLKQGVNLIEWDKKNNNGESVAQGIYGVFITSTTGKSSSCTINFTKGTILDTTSPYISVLEPETEQPKIPPSIVPIQRAMYAGPVSIQEARNENMIATAALRLRGDATSTRNLMVVGGKPIILKDGREAYIVAEKIDGKIEIVAFMFLKDGVDGALMIAKGTAGFSELKTLCEAGNFEGFIEASEMALGIGLDIYGAGLSEGESIDAPIMDYSQFRLDLQIPEAPAVPTIINQQQADVVVSPTGLPVGAPILQPKVISSILLSTEPTENISSGATPVINSIQPLDITGSGPGSGEAGIIGTVPTIPTSTTTNIFPEVINIETPRDISTIPTGSYTASVTGILSIEPTVTITPSNNNVVTTGTGEVIPDTSINTPIISAAPQG